MTPGLRFLLDQGISRDGAVEMRAAGVNCTHLSELGMSTATDTEVLEWAKLHDHVVVTLDSDFHTILAVRQATKPSVVRIRMEGLKGIAIANLLRKVIQQYAEQLGIGCMLTVKRRKTTCHMLFNSE